MSNAWLLTPVSECAFDTQLQPENWAATVSTEADKTKLGLYSSSWLYYYKVLHEIWIQKNEKAMCNRIGHLLAIPRIDIVWVSLVPRPHPFGEEMGLAKMPLCNEKQARAAAYILTRNASIQCSQQLYEL